MEELKDLVGKDFNNLNARDFSSLICGQLPSGTIKKEVSVMNRGDGRAGRVDILYTDMRGKTFGIELDRLYPRDKSIFKLKELKADVSYIITRSPFTIHELKLNSDGSKNK